MPTLASIHIDSALTNVSIAYRNESYIAEMVAPVLPVAKRSDKYFVYDKAAFLSSSGTDAQGKPKSLRRPKSEATETDFNLSVDNYYAEEYARRQLVTDAETQYADSPLQPAIDATQHVTDLLMLDNEVATAAMTLNTNKYSATHKQLLTTGGVGTSWAQYQSANSHPLSDLKNAKIAGVKDLLREYNCALYTVDTARTLADHPDIKDLVKYTHIDALTTSGLLKVLRGLETIEGVQQVNTAPEGKPFASGNVWVDNNGTNVCLVFYRGKEMGPRTVHGFRTFEAPDDTNGARGVNIRRYRWDPKKGEYVEGAMTRDWKSIAKDANGNYIGGYLISGCTL